MLINYFKIGETFKKYFQNLVPNMDLKVQTIGNGDEALTAISKYQNYPYQNNLTKSNFSFSFKTVSLTDIEKEREKEVIHK